MADPLDEAMRSFTGLLNEYVYREDRRDLESRRDLSPKQKRSRRLALRYRASKEWGVDVDEIDRQEGWNT